MLLWFPLLEAGRCGLEQLLVFVLAVWYGSLSDVVCVFGKFKHHRASVDCLWQRLTAVRVCASVNACIRALVTRWVFPQSCQAVNSSVGLFQ